jgi:signal transduction histidine kinase
MRRGSSARSDVVALIMSLSSASGICANCCVLSGVLQRSPHSPIAMQRRAGSSCRRYSPVPNVRTALDKELPKLSANRVQLQQVVLNLVMNAGEAMSSMSGGERIVIIRSQLCEPNEVVILVEDSGPGIDPKHIDRIFEPFFTTKSSGMGMGLSICRSIIEAHHGRLSVSPGIAHGAVFRCRRTYPGNHDDRLVKSEGQPWRLGCRQSG